MVAEEISLGFDHLADHLGEIRVGELPFAADGDIHIVSFCFCRGESQVTSDEDGGAKFGKLGLEPLEQYVHAELARRF